MDTIAGFRLVRRLGSGERAEVHLGQSTTRADGDVPASVAIKVFRPSTPLHSIDREIDALARLSSHHLLSLTDLAVADDGRPVLVLQRVGPMTCARLVLERERLAAGEAVTILAPMIDAVEELSRVGVVHGGIRLDRVAFDHLGAPVLIGFGRARVAGPIPGDDGRPPVEGGEGPARTEMGDAEDTVGLLGVTRSVLEATRPTPGRDDLIRWIGTMPDRPAGFRAELRNRVFDLARPEPVSLTTGIRPKRSVLDLSRPVPAGTPAEAEFDGEASARDVLAAANLPGWLIDLLPRRRSVGTFLRRVSAMTRRFLAPVRRPVWIAAASAGLLLTAALVLSGGGDAEVASAVGGRPVGSTGSEAGASAADAMPAPLPETAAPTAAPPPPADSDAIAGDDAAQAAAALLRGRAGCLELKSIPCLDGIDQAGSAALEADTVLVRERQAGGGSAAPALEDGVPTVVQHLGGTVILALDLPADESADPLPVSVLLVHGEHGWRIRDLIVG